MATEIAPPEEARPIEVNGITLDPQETYAKDARNTDYIVIGVKDRLDKDQHDQLTLQKVEVVEDLGDNNYLCRYKPTDLAAVRALPFIIQADVYRNALKIPQELRSAMEVLAKQPDGLQTLCPIDILPHWDVKDLNAFAATLSATAGLRREEMEFAGTKIRMRVPIDQLTHIAENDKVRVLEEVLTPELHDDQARELVGAPLHDASSQVPFRGAGQTIAVVDSGFDLGKTDDCHPAFAGKIQDLVSLGRKDMTNVDHSKTVDDPRGHGTHVCGTIVGHDFQTSEGLVGGVAPDAKLVVSSLIDTTGKNLVPIKTAQNIFGPIFDKHQAYIHSNSWGADLAAGYTQRKYGQLPTEIDAFIKKNPGVLIVFSAGNNQEDAKNYGWPKGQDKPALGAEAGAKNCLTVGASGSTRSMIDPRNGKVITVNPDAMCENSSCGPTLEGRTKPDVVAPGSNIFSAASRHPRVVLEGKFLAEAPQDPNAKWMTMTGTSHATPLVSGCAAVLREMLQRYVSIPPSFLLKALIINGADRLPRVPQAAQGFGRVNLAASAAMADRAPLFAKDVSPTSSFSMTAGTLIGDPLVQDQEFSIHLTPPSMAASELQALQFKVTMVYNDLDGTAIQNNLNLAVLADGKPLAHGNVSEDENVVQNTVEQVVWEQVPPEGLTVRVRAQKLLKTDGTQDFALAWSLAAPYKSKGKQ